MNITHTPVGLKLLSLAAASLALAACGGGTETPGGETQAPEMITTDSGLMITTTQAGSGVAAEVGNFVACITQVGFMSRRLKAGEAPNSTVRWIGGPRFSSRSVRLA